MEKRTMITAKEALARAKENIELTQILRAAELAINGAADKGETSTSLSIKKESTINIQKAILKLESCGYKATLHDYTTVAERFLEIDWAAPSEAQG